jgi:hypothetical protein
MESLEDLTLATARLLRSLGVDGPVAFEPLPGGANNRVYRVEAGGRPFFLKHCFHHAEDPRDRFAHEWEFGSFAWRRGLRSIAEPLTSDPASRLILCEFVAGTRLPPFDISPDRVLEAARFFRDLNRHRQHADVSRLPDASEASFSLAAHADRIGRRVAGLAHIELKSPACEMAADFVRQHLAPAWEAVRSEFERNTDSSSVAAELTPSERCLSPSDFGFHNALVRTDGSLLFHDFEYAGIDDPVKMVCDFFRQVQSPAPIESAAAFVETALADFDLAPVTRRIELLWPAFRIKWCCIVLNDFLPVAETRRSYAGQPPSELRRRRQLEMAESLLARTDPLPL